MSNTFELGKQIIDRSFDEQAQKLMMSLGEDLAGVIKSYPSIYTTSVEAEKVIKDCVDNGYICKVSWHSEFIPATQFRDNRAYHVNAFSQLKEVIVFDGNIYVNQGQSDTMRFTSNRYYLGTVGKVNRNFTAWSTGSGKVFYTEDGEQHK